MNLLEICPPEKYETAKDWVAALETYGLGIGAKPPGIVPFFTLVTSTPEVCQFWMEITRLGQFTNIEGEPTIEKQLLAAWSVIRG